jgi:hypothetical protein
MHRGSGGRDPRILNLDTTRFRRMVSFIPLPNYPTGKTALNAEQEGGWPQSRSGRGGEENNFSAPVGNRTPVGLKTLHGCEEPGLLSVLFHELENTT